ncbi:MAG TPA: hypothetical protein VFV98_07035 [Vicinamibacterales bacterium]|nr:hypothetical protein [Vicinamibacterales bacterium]
MVEHNDAPLVSVFIAREPGLVPLIRLALEQENIEFSIRGVGALSSVMMSSPDRPVLGVDSASEIFVREEDAERARILLEGLAAAPPEPNDDGMAETMPEAPAAAPAATPIVVYDDDSNLIIGRISEAQLDFLDDHLDEESASDRDYYLTADTIDMLEANGGDAGLIGLLRGALRDRADMTISWKVE